MIRSMTAYARQDVRSAWGSAMVEIRAVNHRYLELHFKLPENLRDMEAGFRSALNRQLSRGKVDVHLRVQIEDHAQGEVQVNHGLAEAINQALKEINRVLDNPAHINAMEVLQWPGVLVSGEADLEQVKADIGDAFGQALTDLVMTRESEGARLRPLITERLDQVQAIVEKVRDCLPTILQHQDEALRARFEDMRIDLDPQRLEQEMLMLAQKADVAEELDRLDTHCKAVRQVLERREPIGRRLDFLMQELNREANTLASKSLVTETTHQAVDLKVLIEQMREQIQNIE